MRNQIYLVVLTIISEVVSKPLQNEETVILRHRMDSDDSASSYVYRKDNHGAPQIYYLSADDLNRKFYSKPTSAPLVYYKPAPYVTYAPNYYYQPKMRSRIVAFKPSPVDTSKSQSSSSESDESHGRDHDSHDKHSSESDDHSEEGGKSHEEKYHKKQGKKSTKGYNKELKYSKGDKGSYEKEYKDKDFEEEGENDSKKYDEADSYHNHEAEGHHKKGGKFGSKKHHKKGSKSKGYHNVFMKDEYKKDHTFYGKFTLQSENLNAIQNQLNLQTPQIIRVTSQSTGQTTKSTVMKIAKGVKAHTTMLVSRLAITLTKTAATRDLMIMPTKATRRNRDIKRNTVIKKSSLNMAETIIIQITHTLMNIKLLISFLNNKTCTKISFNLTFDLS
jgi:hypothetical protein